MKGRIIPSFSWPNKEEFFKNGFGYCLIEEGRIVAAEMVEEILRRGKTPVWDCDIRNEASMRLACSVGFEIVGTHPWYKSEK